MDEPDYSCLTQLCTSKLKNSHSKTHMTSSFLYILLFGIPHLYRRLLTSSNTWPSQHSLEKKIKEKNTAKMNVSEAFKSLSVKSMLGDHVLRNGLSRLAYDQTQNSNMKLLTGTSGTADKSLCSRQCKKESIFSTMNNLVKGKLRLRADKVFKQIFSIREGEQLLKASRCCLFTTAGSISGRLFISTDKIAFCSDRAIAKVSAPTGVSIRFHYKVVIPISKIKRFNQSENMKKPSQKYLQVVTTDDYEFWFLGFHSYKKVLNCVQQALSQS